MISTHVFGEYFLTFFSFIILPYNWTESSASSWECIASGYVEIASSSQARIGTMAVHLDERQIREHKVDAKPYPLDNCIYK